MVAIQANFNNLSFSFFGNILILIALSDCTIEILGYRRSCGVSSEKIENLRILWGPEGGFPPKMSNSFFAKSCVTPLK